jgi:serine/threonine protein kinase
MAVVLRAVDEDLHRELAVKVNMAVDSGGSQGELVRFVEEAQVTAQLEHPNVVPIHDLGVDPQGRPFFSMKLVRGASLEDILQRRRDGDPVTLAHWGLRRLLDVFLQVCQAIEYAHARGVIHRDLKPANIMVGDFGEVLVMDWGVAKVVGRPTRAGAVSASVQTVRSNEPSHKTISGTVLGTPSYMSPEQARGDIDAVDERADIYALGAILYELLCGRPPFEGPDVLSVLTRVLRDQPKVPSDVASGARVPPALEVLAMRLLDKDPDRRNVGIPEIRARIHDHIEGIDVVYRRETWLRKALWSVGVLSFFAFAVWYLTGESAAGLMPPRVALNAAGWFMLILLAGYPLWSILRAQRVSRAPRDRFRRPTEDEVFTSGFLSHRRLTAAIAPIFQLTFVAEVVFWIVPGISRAKLASVELLMTVADGLRAELANALIVPFVLLFAYIFLQASEVRFARSIDRYEPLLRRSAWEIAWPFALIVTLLVTLFGVDMLHWAIQESLNPLSFLQERVLSPSLDVFAIVKTLVFQGTFLLVFMVLGLTLVYPFPELLAALRMRYQTADEAYVRTRRQYFLRSLSVFHVARANALYSGAMIGCLTAVSTISSPEGDPVLAKAIYILGPSLLGFAIFAIVTGVLKGTLTQSPAVHRMVVERVEASRIEEAQARRNALSRTTWVQRLSQFLAPVVVFGAYALWVGAGRSHEVLAEFMHPSTLKEVLLLLPYVLLVPAILLGDALRLRPS